MAKTVCKILGVILILVGVVGFSHVLDPLHAHLSPAHNGVHLVSGVLALYFGFAGSPGGARGFCIIFGIVYLLLGIAGFVLGHPEASTIAGLTTMGTDPKLFKVIPGTLEFGRMDHIIHVVVGILFLAGGALGRSEG